jgi:regulator of protease activity HflC (stomatin/prohibitin superfamily)
MTSNNELSGGTKLVIGLVIFVFALIVIAIINPVVMIGPGEKGVVMNWRAVSGVVMNEGWNWRVPIYQTVEIMNVRTVKEESEVMAYSKDTQTVTAKIALNYHLQGDKVNTIFQTVGNNSRVEDVVIDPAVQEDVKAVIAKYTASELLDKRNEISTGIKDLLFARLGEKNVYVEGISIMNFDFSDAYENAVEQKQVAQQDALKAENKLKQVQFEAEQRVAQAKAEAEAIKIQAEAITQQGGADYVKLKAIEKWKGEVPTTMIPNGSVPFIDLNLTK